MKAPIEIDGGIDETNIQKVVTAGANIIVSGNAIFGKSDPESSTLALLKAALA